MVEIRFRLETQLPAPRVLAAATDFSERRPQIWSGIDPQRYRVHSLGPTWAEVTEGGGKLGGIWARERYDWSTPGVVTAEVQDSNVFRPGSRWELRVSPTDVGGSVVEWRSSRLPRGVKGRIVVAMLRVAGRRHLSAYLAEVLARLPPETAVDAAFSSTYVATRPEGGSDVRTSQHDSGLT